MDELIPSTIIVLLEPVQIEPETYYHIFMTGVLCRNEWALCHRQGTRQEVLRTVCSGVFPWCTDNNKSAELHQPRSLQVQVYKYCQTT